MGPARAEDPSHSRLAQHDLPRSGGPPLLTQPLEEAKTLDEVKAVRDKAEALRLYSRQAKLGQEITNACAELKLRAERRAGSMLADVEMNRGGRPTETSDIVSRVSPPSLTDLGIERHQSSRWQRIAAVPDEVFEQHLEQTVESGRELTTTGPRSCMGCALAMGYTLG